MITPAEIRQKAARQYPAYLRAWLKNEPFFPLDIPFAKIKPTADYLSVRAGLEKLLAESKEKQGYGYTVTLETRATRQYGTQSFPTQIAFETEADYLHVLRKTNEVAAFKREAELVRRTLPQLDDWLTQKPQQVIAFAGRWPDLLKVCLFFLAQPRPDCYIRELPVEVHTKFVETHQGVLRELLDRLLPAEAIRPDEAQFERRFFLRYAEPPVRLRLLDPKLQIQLSWPVTDLSAPLSEIGALNLAGQRVIITENKINFLTLPALPNSLALFGGGFRVELLKEVSWLEDCELLYWGDLDGQGFQILSQLRRYFPRTQSLMMDLATFEAFREFALPGTPSDRLELSHLTAEENALYTVLVGQNLRLEQERISQAFVIQRLQQFEL